MSRQTMQLLKLEERLAKNIERSNELFFRDRPFLGDPTQEPVICQEHTDDEIMEKIENEFEREELAKKIREIAEM